MTLCPVALAVHCVGCPIVKVCPAKTLLGDFGTYTPQGLNRKDAGPPRKK